MSIDMCYEEAYHWLQDRAYKDALIYYEREPTEEELDDIIEYYRDKYCGRCD